MTPNDSAEGTPNPASSPSSSIPIADLIETYHSSSEWIRFADAKAAVVLTVGGAIAGLIVPTIAGVAKDPATAEHWLPAWKPICVSLFALFIAFLLLSSVWAFRCITPFRRGGRHPALEHCRHFHAASIAHHYKDSDFDRFSSDIEKDGAAGFRQQVLAALLIDSHISNEKYSRVTKAIKTFAVSGIFALSYFLARQL